MWSALVVVVVVVVAVRELPGHPDAGVVVVVVAPTCKSYSQQAY
jgi:hypothetical protein